MAEPIDVSAPEVQEVIKAQAEALVKEQTAGLVSKRDELLGELKGYKEKYGGVDLDKYQELTAKEKELAEREIKENELASRLKADFDKRYGEAEKAKQDAIAEKNRYIADNELTSALMKEGVAPEFMDAAKALLQTKHKVDVQDGRAVLDGDTVSDFIGRWSKDAGKAFIKAEPNTGGGASGTAKTNGAKTDVKNWNPAQKAAFIRDNGADAFVKLIKG